MKFKIKDNFLPFSCLFFTAIFTAFFIIFYCQTFYDFGILAKDRILKNPFSTFLITPIFFWLSAYLCRFFSPNSSGSNLYNIRKSLEQVALAPNSFEKISPFLSFKIVIVSTISSLLATLGGGSLGREGPSVHMAASIFADSSNRFKKLFPKISLENWIYAGCGVGFAIAFSAPFAGIIYVAEKLWRSKAKHFYSNLIWTFLAVFVACLALYPLLTTYNVEEVDFTFDAILALILIAIFCGMSAFLFLETCIYFYLKVVHIKSAKWHLAPILGGLAVATIGFYCGIYSIGGGIKTINDSLASADIILTYKDLLGRFFSTIITFISGCAGGFVAPAIAIGGNIGSIAGEIFSDLDVKVLILGGMSAFLSAILRMPITAAIIILEAANLPFISLPFLLMVSFIAFFIDQLFLRLRK